MQRFAAPVILLLSAGLLFSFRNFAADDAYILMRFGVNLVDHGQLVFNLGDYVSSMTSPALGLLYGGLHAVFGEPLAPYKLLSVAALAGSIALVIRHAPEAPVDRALFLALLALCPCMVMWTLGGLETPLLMLVATATAHFALEARDADSTMPVLSACALAGVGFLVRHDAAPLLGSLCLFALAGRPIRIWLSGLSIGALLPIAWLVFAQLYYGDLLPTSYYTKPPAAGPGRLWVNAVYLAENGVLTGTIPVALLVLAATRGRAPGLRAFARGHWGLLLGLGLQLAYTLTMATVHMMFGFRAFVPYLPATALVLAALLRARGGLPGGRTRAVAWIFVLALVVSGIAQGRYTWAHEMNGLATQGRPQNVSAKEATESLAVMAELAGRIRADWATRAVTPERPPTIFTISEGILPYRYPEAYYVGPLVGYRHVCRPKLPALADYVVRLRAEEKRGEFDPERSVVAGPFALGRRSFYAEAYYNPAPKPDRLSTTLSAPCPPPRPSAGPETPS